MTNKTNQKALLLTAEQVDELTAIYEDYMYAVRIYESVFQKSSVEVLAGYKMQKMGLDHKSGFPWQFKLLDIDEKKHFQDFLDEKVHHNTGHAYITLTHTNPNDDKCFSIKYVPQSYIMHKMDMSLPSAVERYIVVFPENAKIKDTEFFIDGKYKVKYTREEYSDMEVSNALHDFQAEEEFRILINFVDSCSKNKDQLQSRFKGLVLNAYAAEVTASYENIMLEMLGSFAEKIQNISRDIHLKEVRQNVHNRAERQKLCEDVYQNALEYAKQDNLIPSAADFIDYVHIRHLMRHQWDTMDELGFFDAAATDENYNTRMEYMASYRRLCDKTMVQRMKSYINVLHQMQYVMRQILPQYFIREPAESNSKFIARVKEYHRQNPGSKVTVEINEAIKSDRYQKLCGNLRKLVPQIIIKDDFSVDKKKFEDLEKDYLRRSVFLQSYHWIECMMMSYCMSRGIEADHVKTWNYFRDHNLISLQDADEWKKFTRLRNALSHNYYNEDLRQQLQNIEPQYIEYLRQMEVTLGQIGPQINWLKAGMYEYIHQDGLRVIIDYKDLRNLHTGPSVAPQISLSYIPQLKQQATSTKTLPAKIDLTDKKYNSRKKKQPTAETYPNGVEFIVDNKQIKAFRMPNGISINFEKQRIIWSEDIKFYANSENFNLLQVVHHKLITDKGLRAISFWEGKHSQPIRGGDMCIMGQRHRAYIDTIGRLKEFNFRNSDGSVEKTTFKKTKTGTEISFSNGTKVLQTENGLSLEHANMVLNYENRQEFAASYQSIVSRTPLIIKNGNEL